MVVPVAVVVAAAVAVIKVIEKFAVLVGSRNAVTNTQWNFVRNLPIKRQTNKSRTRLIARQFQDSQKKVFQETNLK